jgi:hypothetical protein
MNIQVDLKRNPDVASLISDLNMGDGVCFCTSLKSRSADLAEFTLEKAVETPESMKDSDEDEEESEDEAEVDGDQMKKTAKMPAPGGSPNTPGGSVEQDRLAASLTAQI